MLPRTSPSAAGVDAERVRSFLRAAREARLELHSLMLVRRGHVVAEGWWAPYDASAGALVYSLSKAFTSTAVGIAVGEGLLDLDDVVADTLGPTLPRRAADWVRTARVRDLLAMATGHEVDPIDAMRATYARGGDPLAAFLATPAQHPPGEVFTYNQGATLTLAAILARVTGQPLLDWLRPRLLEPLGIEGASWTPMPGVVTGSGEALAQGFSGIHVRTEAIAALGELWRCGGRWGPRQLVPADYVAQATRVHVETADRALTPDWRRGYGFQLWRSRHGYRGDGAFGQLCLVLPEHEAVLAVTAQTERMQGELDLVWEHLVPALVEGPRTPPTTEPDADAALAADLAALALPTMPGEFAPGDGLLGVDLPVPTPPPLLHRLVSVRIDAGRPGEPGPTLTWRADGQDHRAPIGVGTWARGELPSPWMMHPPVAICGAADAEQVRLRIAYLAAPHSLTLTATRAGARLAWTTTPLA